MTFEEMTMTEKLRHALDRVAGWPDSDHPLVLWTPEQAMEYLGIEIPDLSDITAPAPYTPVPIEAPLPQVKIQPWGEEITLAETPAYTLKKLVYHAGQGGNLQMHTRKVESFHLASGNAYVWGDLNGKLWQRWMAAGDTLHIPAGAAHRFTAISECVVYEASTNVSDDRVRLEKWYGEPEVDGLPSTAPEPTR